ncbi:MAG: tRNA (N(6)-L-threonylcarbamoyladenosine(37)-C(2))-methylthiotransferase MtaB [Saprospiraceae bacterium]|nr:tRNA (N(6)-L-threonylcarbamoyladenosine(37)-C(2))-methylthiotransferase MtaB [Saprospiraceae bacterium]
MSTARSVAFHTLGCKLNYSETSTISTSFKNAGYEEVDFDQPADFYIINTCSVTDQADKKCRKVIRSAKKNNPDSKIVVIGCYAQLKPKEISEIPGVNLVLGAAEKFNVLEHLQEIDLQNPHSRVFNSEIKDVAIFNPSYSQEGRTRAFLKVQDGCDYKCSFCTIPLARGRSRSGTIPQIISLANELVEKGIKEVVLTGVNIGDFGNGTEVIEGTKVKKEELFIDLIKALELNTNVARYRISSIEPNLCTEEIIQFVAESKRFMPHFHMPLQSGDNEILALMKRRYKSELYSERVSAIKRLIPHACIGVDVIVGFPGETDMHFNNTFQFLEDLNVDYFHVFSYSERSNTPAASMAGSVPVNIRSKRSEALRILSIKKKLAFYNRFLNTNQNLLLENKEIDGTYSGFTENYIRVVLESADSTMLNQVQKISLSKIYSNGDVLGSLV